MEIEAYVRRVALCAVSGVLLVTTSAAAQPAEIVHLALSDSLAITGDLFRTDAPADAPAILLFHQGGGDARGEYAPIIPRLLDQGFHVLSTDVRGGGDRFGDGHRAAPTQPGFDYCIAYPEVEAALSLARANGLTGPLILWGSSYTATLVVQVAARRTADVRAVLAFSPAGGAPLAGCQADVYAPWLARAGVPLFITRSSEELSNPPTRERFDRLIEHGARSFVAEGSGHGSSLLVASRFAGDVAPLWSAVLEFLGDVRAPRLAPITADPVTIPSDGWQLHGDLQLPQTSGPAPVAVLLHKAAGSRSAYAGLARALADRGVASLRIDLRGHGESTNRGRFLPFVPGLSLAETHHDVLRVLEAVRGVADIDSDRMAIVSASYSAEAAATALRSSNATRARAVVALSPGDLSDASFAALANANADWLFVRGDAERFVGPWLDEKVRTASTDADLWILETGSAHATDLLLADPTLTTRLADWIATRLR